MEPESRGPNDETPKTTGRPSSFKQEYVETARRMCSENGATDKDLAKEFGVAISTIWRWSSKYPEFRSALKVNKDIADDSVERSLYQKALGYTFDSEKIFLTKEGEVVRVPTVEHVPPSDTAMIFWLKNRRPNEWRDRKEIDADVDTKVVITGGLPE